MNDALINFRIAPSGLFVMDCSKCGISIKGLDLLLERIQPHSCSKSSTRPA